MCSKGINKLLEISDDVKQFNLKKLNLTEKDLADSVEIITKWFKQQPHLPNVIPDKRRVENIYISCKGSIERSKSVLDNFYSLKTALPDIFSERDPLRPDALDAAEEMRFTFLYRLMDDKTRLVALQTPRDSKVYDLAVYMKYTFMFYDLRMLYDSGCDVVTICDFHNLQMRHIVHLTPTKIKILITACQEAFVARIKGLHFVNVPRYAEALMSLIRSLLSEKIKSRLFIHSSYDDLHKVIDKKYLPRDFNGDLPTLKETQDAWFKELREMRDWFLEEDKHKTNESRRPGKPVINELLGTHGSFRKLDVD